MLTESGITFSKIIVALGRTDLDRLKGLLWCGDRFILLYIRLADGRFQWPRTADEARHISGRQFVQLMEGYSIDPSIGKPVSQPAPAIRKRS